MDSRRLTLKVEGRDINVPRVKYVQAKCKQLREFGYTNLTEKEVDSQIDCILQKKPLDVIGKFMEDEVISE